MTSEKLTGQTHKSIYNFLLLNQKVFENDNMIKFQFVWEGKYDNLTLLPLWKIQCLGDHLNSVCLSRNQFPYHFFQNNVASH